MTEFLSDQSASGPPVPTHYFGSFTVPAGEHILSLRCVLCSISVEGHVENVKTLWGDVEVKNGGEVQDVWAVGGEIRILAGAKLPSWALIRLWAVGGSVVLDPSVKIERSYVQNQNIISQPGLFYPGQSSFPARGLATFLVFAALTAVCGGGAVSEELRVRSKDTLRRPVGNVVLSGLLLVLAFPLGTLAVILLWAVPPLFVLIYVGAPVAYWLCLVLGFAALAEQTGLLLGARTATTARLTGSATWFALMLIPVVGFFVMVIALLLTLGAVPKALLSRWRIPARIGVPKVAR